MFDSLPENDGFWNRRHFLKAAGAVAAGATLTRVARAGANPDALALNGGAPAVTVPLKKQLPVLKWPQYAAAEKDAVKAALDCDCGNVYHYLYDLEDKWRKYVGTPFVKSHMNGTSAITAMFFALDLPPGSEIMVPSYTFFGAIVPMRLFGYVPVFVDINPRTATFDVEHAKRVLTPRVKAVMPMHSWGLPCEMDHVLAFAKEKGLHVLEGLRPRPRSVDARQENGLLRPHGHLQLPRHQATAGFGRRDGDVPAAGRLRAGRVLRPL